MSKTKSKAFNLSELSYKQYYWVLAIVVVLVFGNTLFNGYNYDDNLVTMHHPSTSKGVKSVGKIFTSPYYTDGADISFGYRPIVHLSFAIEHQFFGEKPAVSHFFNLLIYLGCVLAFFKLISNWFGNDALFFAFMAAALFAVHPIHSEAVASIKNRDELLAFLFAMLAFIQLNHYADKKQWWRILFAVFLFGIALLSKKSVYPLIFLVPLVVFYVHKQSVKATLSITAIISSCAALAASAFVIDLLLPLAILPIAWYLIVLGVHQRKRINSIIQYAWFGYVMLVIAFLLSVATVYYQEFAFFALAVCLYLFTYKLPIKSTILWLMVVLSGVMVGVGLQLPVVNHVLLLLSLFVAVPSLKERKFNAIEISCLLISSLAVLSHNPSIGTTALIGVYIITAFFWQKKSWVSVGFLGIVVTIMFVFFQIRYQYVMLLFLVVYLAIATYKSIIQERFRPQVMLMILLLPIWFLSSTPRTFATGYWINISNQEQSASLAKQQVLSTLKDIEKNEGRSLSYVENTLIGTQTLEAKISTGVVVIGEYLRLLFFPKELNFYYGFAKIKTSSFTDIKFITSLLGLVLTIGLTFVFGNKNRLILIGAVWVATSVLLFSNWVELVAGMVGERLAFTASGGFCLLVGLILSSITSRVNMKTTSYLFILIAGLFSLRTIARNTNWESHLALIEHDIEHLSESVYAQHMYAQICMNEATTNRKLGEEERIQFVKKAEYALVKANTVYPYYFNAQFDLARIYIMQQRFSEAKRYLDNAYALDSNNVFVVEELAKTCFDLNLQSETVKYAEKYLILYPQNENMYEILAYTLFKKGDLDLARHYIEMGLKYYPQGKNLLGLLGDINDNESKNKLDKKSE